MSQPPARIPIKLHKQVALIRTSEPLVAEELLARKSLRSAAGGTAFGHRLAGSAGG